MAFVSTSESASPVTATSHAIHALIGVCVWSARCAGAVYVMQGGWVAPWLLSCCAVHCVMQALTVLGVAGPAWCKKSRQRTQEAAAACWERAVCTHSPTDARHAHAGHTQLHIIMADKRAAAAAAVQHAGRGVTGSRRG
jgi:hypothetical protein